MISFELKEPKRMKVFIALEGFTIRSFSQKIGISHSFLSQILNSQRKASPKTAKKIADGLNKNLNEIFLIKTVDNQPIKEEEACYQHK